MGPAHLAIDPGRKGACWCEGLYRSVDPTILPYAYSALIRYAPSQETGQQISDFRAIGQSIKPVTTILDRRVHPVSAGEVKEPGCGGAPLGRVCHWYG